MLFSEEHNAKSASFNLESSPVVAQSTVIYLSASHKGQQKVISTETAFQLFPQRDAFHSVYLAGILDYQKPNSETFAAFPENKVLWMQDD